LQVGALGAGLSLSGYLRAAEEEKSDSGRSGILIFLQGGPSHLDTFDMKPEAPADHRGPFRPIKSSIPGVEICEHLPRLARGADRYAVVRGVTHNLADHGLGEKYLLTGNRPSGVLQYPSLGSAAGRELAAPSDMPAYVAVDRDPAGPGYLGVRYGALATGEKPQPRIPFRVRGVTLEDGLTLEQFQRRRQLANDVDAIFRGYEDLDPNLEGLDVFSRQAHQIIASPRARQAFDLEQESSGVKARFGDHEMGMSCLLALRLIEAGTRFVTVLVDGWDTHNDNFNALQRDLLPKFDQSFSALLETLEARGMLDSTAVFATGEFGRTPKINGQQGRDHWPRAMFAVFAGGSVRGGQAIGASDDKGAEPAGDAYSPDDLAATFYQNLGLDPRREYHANTGRPITLIRDGNPIPGVLG
jgi:hypothetical protein